MTKKLQNKVYKVILFNDIVGSSKLWKKHGTKMLQTLDKLLQLIKTLTIKHKGFIIKFIGDSFNISFDTIANAINFTLELYDSLNKSPISPLSKSKSFKLNEEDIIKLRTGICIGFLQEYSFFIQNCQLVDYFGNVINTASRMESKISSVGGLAIGFPQDNDNKKKITIIDEVLNYLNTHPLMSNYKIEQKFFTNKCNSNQLSMDRFKRSSKLLHDLNIKCSDISELKGVDKVFVINIKPI